MVMRTEAIKNFLMASTHSDLAQLYHYGMECQVNAAQDGGERVEGEYKGKKYQAWTDGLQTWKSMRIPYGSMKDPKYEDKKMTWDLEEHAEGIGMTGWCWEKKQSLWVAYDFDSIIGHSDKHEKKLSQEELKELEQAVTSIPWVTVRHSTGGNGLHIYVYLGAGVSTNTHTEHAALARCILGMMSGLSGIALESKVDACGGNMWVWHRKMRGKPNALKLIKKGSALTDIPPNWRDHIPVVTGKRRKNLPRDIEKSGVQDEFEALIAQRPRIKLDEEHKRLINWLRENYENTNWWWDSDNSILVTHTAVFKHAHDELSLKGFYDTSSPAKDIVEQNCFASPLRSGAWVIRRYTKGTAEHGYWYQDPSGWTTCYFNREPDLAMACRAKGGLEDPNGGFVFREAEVGIQAAMLLGVSLNLPNNAMSRPLTLKAHKDGRLIAEIDAQLGTDKADEFKDWLPKNKKWTRVANIRVSDPHNTEHQGSQDDLVRHIVTPDGVDAGWVVFADNTWNTEPKDNVSTVLSSLGYKAADKAVVMGASILKPWRIVNRPFESEYPGDREWNRKGAQIAIPPSTKPREELQYHHWSLILNHCGEGLNEAVSEDPWCRSNGIHTGGDYLKCWVASLFQHPTKPLPYLFFYSTQQNTGKSSFHEALSMLLTHGYQDAKISLTNEQGFNGELEGCVLAIVEEFDLSKNKNAYNRIKEWVTGIHLNVHPKRGTPYHVQNTLHFVHCANSATYCPIFPGDTRITVSHVPPLDPMVQIPRERMRQELLKEAPDFIAEILNLEIPVSNDRLRVPVIESEAKSLTAQDNASAIDQFFADEYRYSEGDAILLSEVFDRFKVWCADNGVNYNEYSKIRFGREIPEPYIKGRRGDNNQVAIANIARHSDAVQPTSTKFRLVGDKLVRVEVGKSETSS